MQNATPTSHAMIVTCRCNCGHEMFQGADTKRKGDHDWNHAPISSHALSGISPCQHPRYGVCQWHHGSDGCMLPGRKLQ